jgi:hypothetical protein
MLRSRALLVMLGLPAAVVAIEAGCGGAIVPSDADPATGAEPTRDPRPPSAAFDASRDVAADVAPGPCACTDEIPQVEGTCMYTIAPRLVDCVAERSDDASSVRLDLWRSCISDGPPAWTPSVKPTALELCSCLPGEKHTLCVRYR